MSATRWLEPLVVAAAAGFYFSAACPYVLGGDNGEYATLLETGGVAHPPGFPLYILVLRAFRWIPAGSSAHRAAIVTAAFATLSVFFVGRACLAWGASFGATGIATAAYASSAIAWKLATHAEVFAPTAAVAAAVLFVSAPASGTPGARKAALLGLLAGLGLSLHSSVVLLAPVGLVAFVSTVRKSARPAASIFGGALGLFVGLLPYLYLLESARHADPRIAWVWGDVHDAASLFRHFRRADYGSLSLSLRASGPDPAAHVPRLVASVTRELLGLPVVALLAAGVWVAVPARRTRTPRERKIAVAALVASFALIGPGFAALFNRPLTDVGGAIVERFYLLPSVPMAVLSALALDELVPTLVEARTAFAFVPLTLVAGFGLSADAVREESRPTVEFYARNVLASVPAKSVILGGGDHRFGAFLYADRALGLRPDVAFVSPRLLLSPWYRAREAARIGTPLALGTDGRLDLVGLVANLLAAGHPVFLAGFVANGIERSFPTYPYGPLVRVLPPGTAAPSPDAVERANVELLARFRLEPTPPASPNGWGGMVHTDYATPWLALADVFARDGDLARARASRHRARVLAPWTVTDGTD